MTVLFERPAVDAVEARRLVGTVPWFHRVEPIEGLITPGWVGGDSYDAAGYVDSFGLGDVKGLKILEIGTWDGPLAYELALRGAQVTASDIQDPSKTGFNVLGKIGGLSVPYQRASVYDLGGLFPEQFDVVLFLGVFYHLKYPVLAFESIAKSLKQGGKLIAEGGGMPVTFDNVQGKPVEVGPELVAALDALDALGVPVRLTYPGTYIGGDNWHLPNRSALHGWMEGAGFEVQGEAWQNSVAQGRRVGATGIKAREPNQEHVIIGD